MVNCPYCHVPAKLESSTKVYRHDYGVMWICANYPACDAYVGCHKGTTHALGRLANPELRYWKKRAHAAFDPLWQDFNINKVLLTKTTKKGERRGAAYSWLASELSIPVSKCHIGMFDIEACKRVVDLCSPYGVENLHH